jgi:hypothetical protein
MNNIEKLQEALRLIKEVEHDKSENIIFRTIEIWLRIMICGRRGEIFQITPLKEVQGEPTAQV